MKVAERHSVIPIHFESTRMMTTLTFYFGMAAVLTAAWYSHFKFKLEYSLIASKFIESAIHLVSSSTAMALWKLRIWTAFLHSPSLTLASLSRGLTWTTWSQDSWPNNQNKYLFSRQPRVVWDIIIKKLWINNRQPISLQWVHKNYTSKLI